MHLEILNDNQVQLLDHIQQFSNSFYLAGGTAIALHIGHRRSIDFDFFSSHELKILKLKKILQSIPYTRHIIFEDVDQLHIVMNKVRLTFLHYPYAINSTVWVDGFITMPDLLTLSAMKAFALGRRAKWKDYVDLFFILKDHYSIDEVALAAKSIYADLFSEKMFRQQLAFHQDVDFTESVEFIESFALEDQIIKNFLIDKATTIF